MMYVLRNNYIPLAQLVLRKVSRPSASRAGLARETSIIHSNHYGAGTNMNRARLGPFFSVERSIHGSILTANSELGADTVQDSSAHLAHARLTMLGIQLRIVSHTV